jgi:hypothetical protein
MSAASHVRIYVSSTALSSPKIVQHDSVVLVVLFELCPDELQLQCSRVQQHN